MELRDTLITTPSIDICSIDIEKAVECFNKRCSISRWNNEYRLCETNLDFTEHILKVTISEEDAKKLIEKLSLIENKSDIFKNASTFRLGN